MRIPIIDGRAIDDRDDASAPRRVVISRALANQLFSNERAVGRQLRLADGGVVLEVVGVAGDVKHRALEEADIPTVYLSAWQSPSNSSHVVIRTTQPEADVFSIVREEVARLDVSGIRFQERRAV